MTVSLFIIQMSPKEKDTIGILKNSYQFVKEDLRDISNSVLYKVEVDEKRRRIWKD